MNVLINELVSSTNTMITVYRDPTLNKYNAQFHNRVVEIIIWNNKLFVTFILLLWHVTTRERKEKQLNVDVRLKREINNYLFRRSSRTKWNDPAIIFKNNLPRSSVHAKTYLLFFSKNYYSRCLARTISDVRPRGWNNRAEIIARKKALLYPTHFMNHKGKRFPLFRSLSLSLSVPTAPDPRDRHCPPGK